ncbi:hypothetical protein AJ80_07855 [Polytolypa hystricis UAMH7299]|uniref:Uncharacterized protein n=1 Tax=Polytolypa hystricis (strain UAMH7299) TaxID=1447883 RepID=A0A2B7XH55_POLH7|nr:hypothetical protein AJ80_07855 [Polytolypa hystricis UAMH7299]
MASRFGLELVYPTHINKVPTNQAVVDIIFVHGLFGNPQHTWTGKKTDSETKKTEEVFWVQQLLPAVLPNARIFTWGYDADVTHLLSNSSQATIFEHSRTLLSDISDERITEEDEKRGIIFVCHSLGGVLVKDALNCSQTERTHLKKILPATIGVVFLGTPHRGSTGASMGKWAFEAMRALAKKPNMTLLRDLERSSETLDRIGRGFSQLLGDKMIKIQSFYEEVPMKGLMVVDRSSYAIWDSTEIAIGIPADHSAMTKYSSPSEIGFKRVSAVLRRWTTEYASTMLPSKPHPPSCKLYEKDYLTRYPCLRSLNRPEGRYRFEDLKPAHTKTFQWLFTEELPFLRWLRGDLTKSQRIFWISGKPGSGKSTLMKLALQSRETRELLQAGCSARPILASFFFYDRGTPFQKSMEGFLYELLYQILDQAKELMPVVCPTFEREIFPRAAENPSNFSRSGAQAAPGSKEAFRQYFSYDEDIDLPLHPKWDMQINWTLRQLQRCLREILTQRHTPIKLCLFVDGLDEYNGSSSQADTAHSRDPMQVDNLHREIADFLTGLIDAADGTVVDVRICAASRPLSIFELLYGGNPDLIIQIHEQTRSDILNYTSARLEHALHDASADEDIQSLQLLCDEIAEKASGVFIWVRLAVNELIEGISDGDTISQLRQRLSVIPEELGHLYRRILERIKSKYAREAYLMLQVVLCIDRPIMMKDLFAIVDFELRGPSAAAAPYPPYPTASQTQLKRRLMSRCLGLLELTNDSNVRERKQYVQFLHLTLKEYLDLENGNNSLAVFRGDREIDPQNMGFDFLGQFEERYPDDYLRIYNSGGSSEAPAQTSSTISKPAKQGPSEQEPKNDEDIKDEEVICSLSGKSRTELTKDQLLCYAVCFNQLSYVRRKLFPSPAPARRRKMFPSPLHCSLNPSGFDPALTMERASDDMIHLLLEDKAMLKDNYLGRTPLVHLIVDNPFFSEKSLNIVRSLLENGADPNAIVFYLAKGDGSNRPDMPDSERGWTRLLNHTILHTAFDSEIRRPLLEMLCEHGANVDSALSLVNGHYDREELLNLLKLGDKNVAAPSTPLSEQHIKVEAVSPTPPAPRTLLQTLGSYFFKGAQLLTG